MSTESDEFEQTVQSILDNLRVALSYTRVEGSKKYTGRVSGRRRQIDATAFRTDGGIILVECKLYGGRVKAEVVQAFHYMITKELGAAGGLIVTGIGYQAAAEAIARAEQIGTAILNPEATEHDYVLSIAGRLFTGMSLLDVGIGSRAISQVTYP